ncbi:glycosyltransferase [Megasphaera cerevisiae]|uniref:glycosyltransferase n=1 Tax=Megasphaera cerevisiae TaxID=39029 RepID=UPI0009444441|nr:glycosyltransferase [Megasphaera cerevisiae]OKY52779.1 hypothetical protein BSR42_11140 [Megasphaera cerevisiae]
MNNIVILTSRYPYNSGEEFLEEELEIESKFFNIYIFACDVTESTIVKKRQCPKGVKSNFLFKKKFSRYEKIVYGTKAVFSKSFLNSLIDMIKRKKLNTKNLKKSIVFIASGKRISKALHLQIENCEKLKSTDTILYSYWSMSTLYAALEVKKKFGFKVVARAHDGDVTEQELTGFYLPLRKRILEAVNRCYPVSYNMAFYIRKILKANVSLCVNHIGSIDLGIRKCLISKENPIVIVTCAMISPIKRIELIVEALKLIQDKKILWIHFGGGDKEFELIREMAKSLPSNIKVQFPGMILHDKLMNFYQDNDVHIFINSSSTEGIPVSVMEAMSFGIPAIATNVGGTSELVNSDTGVLLPYNITGIDIANAIENIINLDTTSYQKMRASARKKWMTDFNGKNNFLNLVNNIQELF